MTGNSEILELPSSSSRFASFFLRCWGKPAVPTTRYSTSVTDEDSQVGTSWLESRDIVHEPHTDCSTGHAAAFVAAATTTTLSLKSTNCIWDERSVHVLDSFEALMCSAAAAAAAVEATAQPCPGAMQLPSADAGQSSDLDSAPSLRALDSTPSLLSKLLVAGESGAGEASLIGMLMFGSSGGPSNSVELGNSAESTGPLVQPLPQQGGIDCGIYSNLVRKQGKQVASRLPSPAAPPRSPTAAPPPDRTLPQGQHRLRARQAGAEEPLPAKHLRSPLIRCKSALTDDDSSLASARTPACGDLPYSPYRRSASTIATTILTAPHGTRSPEEESDEEEERARAAKTLELLRQLSRQQQQQMPRRCGLNGVGPPVRVGAEFKTARSVLGFDSSDLYSAASEADLHVVVADSFRSLPLAHPGKAHKSRLL